VCLGGKSGKYDGRVRRVTGIVGGVPSSSEGKRSGEGEREGGGSRVGAANTFPESAPKK
jgi:hypothetical protein